MNKKKPFWDKKYGKESICAITLTRLRPGRNKKGETYIIKLKKCKHLFYRSALLLWYKKDERCPVCRQKIIF